MPINQIEKCRMTGELYRYEDAMFIRHATEPETVESIRQSREDGGAGIILVDGTRCYVEGGEIG